MSWAQENKFLTGLIAVTVVGAGALGYFAYTAKAKYDTVSEELDKTASEKKRLETLPVYPNAANLKKLEAQREEHLASIQELQKKLKTMELPEESLTPQGFQDRLRASVTAYKKAADDAKMKIADPKFYMGFDVYQTKTPDEKTAPKLARQLRAIEQVLNYLPANRALELRKIYREPLPEEGGGRAKPKPAPAKPGQKKTEPEVPLVTNQPFEIVFECEQATLQNTLNSIVTAKSQFYIVRNILIKNEKPNPPTRELAAPAPEAAPAAPAPGAAPAAPAAPGEPGATTGEAVKIIVGEEKIEATLQIDITEFAEPPQKETKGAKKK